MKTGKMFVFFCYLEAYLFTQLNIIVTRTSLRLVETASDIALQSDIARTGNTALHVAAFVKPHPCSCRTKP